MIHGSKRATAGLGWGQDRDPALVPVLGGYNVVTERDGTPRAVTRTVEVSRRAFEDVDAQFAFDEGEGDRSLAFWRDAHWKFFGRECEALGLTPSPNMPVVLERFELLWAGEAEQVAETLRGFQG